MFSYFVRNVSFPIFAYTEGMPGIMQDLHDLEDSQHWPLERLHNLQRILLKRLLVHAYENTEFYRKRFDDSGLNPYTFKHTEELKKIPVLTKEQVHKSLSGLRAKNFRDDELRPDDTCEITGPKVKFYRDSHCLARKQAALYRFDKWPGWDIGERIALVWPLQQDCNGYWTVKARVKNAFYRREVAFTSAVVDDDLCTGFLRELRAKRPVVIKGFPTPMSELAGCMVSQGVDDISMKGVITTGEQLYPHQRSLISQAFRCEVFDSYRSREAGPIAQECREHNGMHMNAESVYVEIDSPGLSSKEDGEAGNIIVTDLLNYGQPFIRYCMNDAGRLSPGKCACGSELPLLKRMPGKRSDAAQGMGGQKNVTGSAVPALGCAN